MSLKKLLRTVIKRNLSSILSDFTDKLDELNDFLNRNYKELDDLRNRTARVEEDRKRAQKAFNKLNDILN